MAIRLNAMRLQAEHATFIKRTITDHFGDGSRVWLFGSRADDARRGGDVDLYVEPNTREGLFDRRVRCLGELMDGLPYPVDLVVAEPGVPRAIDRIAQKQGVPL